MGSVLTMRSSHWATLLIAACIVVPQLIVAALSPWVGTRAQIWGRRPLLLIGFAALPMRGLLFASVTNPDLLVVVQLLDGVTAAVFAVMVPLVIADLTRGTGHFNLGQGIVGTSIGIGASLSATLAGYISRPFRQSAWPSPAWPRSRSVGLALCWLRAADAGDPPENAVTASDGKARPFVAAATSRAQFVRLGRCTLQRRCAVGDKPRCGPLAQQAR